MVALGGWAVSYRQGIPVERTLRIACQTLNDAGTDQRQQCTLHRPAPAMHVAQPEGCAALRLLLTGCGCHLLQLTVYAVREKCGY